MKMTLIALGITALLVGLLLSSLIWDEYSGNTSGCHAAERANQNHDRLFQQVQAAKGTAQEAVLTKEYKEHLKPVLSLVKMCEEVKLSGRNYLIIFSSLAGVGFVLAISAFLFGRKKEPEETGYSKIDF